MIDPGPDNSCAIQHSECPIVIFGPFIKSAFAQRSARLALSKIRLLYQSINAIDRLKPSANLRTGITASLPDTVLRGVLSAISMDDGEQFEKVRHVMMQQFNIGAHRIGCILHAGSK